MLTPTKRSRLTLPSSPEKPPPAAALAPSPAEREQLRHEQKAREAEIQRQARIREQEQHWVQQTLWSSDLSSRDGVSVSPDPDYMG